MPLFLPCPFCGKSTAVPGGEKVENHYEYFLWCNNCGARGPNEISPEKALEMWNLRRQPETQTEQPKPRYSEAGQAFDQIEDMLKTASSINITISPKGATCTVSKGTKPITSSPGYSATQSLLDAINQSFTLWREAHHA